MKSRFLVLGVTIAFALACGGSTVDVGDGASIGAVGGGGSLPASFDMFKDILKDGNIQYGTDTTVTMGFPSSTDAAALGGKLRDAAKAAGWSEIGYSDMAGSVGGTFQKDGKTLVISVSPIGSEMNVSLVMN